MNQRSQTETLKLLVENIRKTLQDIYVGKNYLNWTLTIQEIRTRIDKWDYIRLKKLVTSKSRDNLQNVRKSLTDIYLTKD
jgi:hypothetical protein